MASINSPAGGGATPDLHPLLLNPLFRGAILNEDDINQLIAQETANRNEDDIIEQEGDILENAKFDMRACNKVCDTKYYKMAYGFDNSPLNNYNTRHNEYIKSCVESLISSNKCINYGHLSNNWQLANFFYNELKKTTFSRYIPFSLRSKYVNAKIKNKNTGENINTRILSKCTQLGWPQSEGDCWIDSYFYSLFMNDKLSPIISDLCNKIIYNKSPETYEYKIIMCINMYLHLLKEKAQKGIQYTQYKRQLKFCICVFSLQMCYENGINPDIAIFGLAKPSKSESDDWRIEGGLVSDFGLAFNIIFGSVFHYNRINNNYIFYTSSFPNDWTESNTRLLETTDRLKHVIESTKEVSADNKILQLDLFLGERTVFTNINFKELEHIKIYSNNYYYILESICVGTIRPAHQTTYTLCDGKWRYYNNEGTRAKSTKQLELDTEIKVIAKEDMYNRINTDISIKNIRVIQFTYSKERSSDLTKGGFFRAKQHKTYRKRKSAKRKTRSRK